MLRRVLAVIAPILALTGGAAAQNTNAQLLTLITSNIPSGNPSVLTAASLRAVLNAMVNSTNVAGTSCLVGSISSYQPFANTTSAPGSVTLNAFDGSQCLTWASINQTTHALSLFLSGTSSGATTINSGATGGLVVTNNVTTSNVVSFFGSNVAGGFADLQLQNQSSSNSSQALIQVLTGIANSALTILVSNTSGSTSAASLAWTAATMTGGLAFTNGSNTVAQMITGLQVGQPTGGDKGAGTLNVQSTIWTNGTQAITQTCTISTGGTIVFTNGLLTSGSCNH